MAAELVGGAFLSSFLNVLFDRMSDPEIINMMLGKKVDQLLQRLKTILNVVEAVLNDAEKKQITDPAVKRWLENLQDAVYDVDDLLDEVATKAAIQKDPGNFLSRFLNLQDTEMITSRMQDAVLRLESIVNQKYYLGLKDAFVRLESVVNKKEQIPMADMSWRIPSTSLVNESNIYGRDKDREGLVKLLLHDANDGEISVIPIVGRGGIGKTTLAQLVYNDDRMREKFDVRVWLCVGEEEFDVLKATRNVIEALTSSQCDMNNDLNLLQLRLKEMLARKALLLVLDDLWNIDYGSWKHFLMPFKAESVRVKILVTTRLHPIASMVETIPTLNLSLLDDDYSWAVFAKHAFLPAESRDLLALERVGKEIVKKCKGLPLAVQTLGGLLRSKYDVGDWYDVLNSEIWEFSESNVPILNVLRISYHYLPSHLKRCFVYCSLYPKDYEFHRDELILLWMAEDLLQQPKSESILEEVGYKYFNELVARSFFQPSNNAYKNSFVMHDLIHDLATFYGEKFFVRTFEPENVAKHDNKSRHLSYDLNDDDSVLTMLEACDSLSHVRTLLQINKHLYREHKEGIDPCHLLAQVKRLRVLPFTSFKIDSLPDSIGELIHLRYLDLSNTPLVTLPESVSNLYNLQTLKLQKCRRLKRLPNSMQNLVKLRHLDIGGTDLEEMPKKMSKLKELQLLSKYTVGKHEENGVAELGDLVNLRGSLGIEKLENVVNCNEACKARMVDKKYISDLWLEWSSGEDSDVVDSQIERSVLDKLHPHKELKELSIRGYRGTMFPDWVGHSSYHNMTKVYLFECRNCWVLPSLGRLPSLMRLEVSQCDNVKMIGASFYKGDGTHHNQETPFRSLKFLSFSDMACWEEWESFDSDDDHAPFPQLEHLLIQRCPKLRGNLPTFLPSLKSLNIDGCEQLGCYLPRAPAIRELTVYGNQEARMRDLPLPLQYLTIEGKQLVESLFEAMVMTHTQPTSLTELSISNCSTAISFPGDSLPPSLQELYIYDCKNLEFPVQCQQHHSLESLHIGNSCDSLASFALPAFSNLKYLTIARREKLTSLGELSQSRSLLRLSISGCPKLEKIKVPCSLRELRISECRLLGERIQRKYPHIWPTISHIPYIEVNGRRIRNDSTS